MYRDTYEEWLKGVADEALQSELASIKDDDEQIKERFLNEMPFGTAGLRGIIGAGISRMNIYTVGRATQGLADFVLAHGKPEQGMAIAYDSRRFSREFAVRVAEIFAGNGIKAYLFRELTSVPELSFAVRHLKAYGGVVITASHNPKDYNGYKVYASYGGQLGPEESLRVTECIQKVDMFNGVKRMNLEEGVQKGLIRWIGEEIDRAYYEKLLSLCPKDKPKADLKIVYTPLHGTGLRTVKNVFPAAGLTNLTVVKEQSEPDGNFPTVKSPNPEDKTAMKMAIDLAIKEGADLAIGTDPDADRLGAAVRDANGEYVMLTGNQIGCILAAHLLETRKQKGILKDTDYIVKSFVSTRMADAVAASYHIQCNTVLTGFRFISEMITENEGKSDFVFGFEESFGFLAGEFTRDKDGAMAGLLLSQAALACKAQGKTLLDVLKGLYEQFGYYLEGVKSIVFAGVDGMDKMKAIMAKLREKQYDAFTGLVITSTEDYLSRTAKDAKGNQTPLSLPKTDALRFVLETDAWLCVRPSGTEPKLKLYMAVHEPDREKAASRLELLEKEVTALIGSL